MNHWLVMYVWGEDADEKPEFAVVGMTNSEMNYIESLIQTAKDLKAEFDQFYCMEMWDYSPNFYGYPPEEIEDIVYGDDDWSLRRTLPALPDRMCLDYCLLRITERSFQWIARPKHWNSDYTTSEITMDELRKELDGE